MEKYSGQHIVRQNVLSRALELLVAKGLIKENEIPVSEDIKKLKLVTDALEKIITNE